MCEGRKMMRTAILVLMALTLGAARNADAAGFITPFIGYNFGGDSANCLTLTNCQEKRTNWGVSIGTLSGVGFEEDISWAKNFFGDVPGADNSVFTAMTNLMIAVPAGPIHPYILGGVGLIRPHVSSSIGSVFSFSNNSFGWDFGGGLHIMFGRIGVRGDLRRFKTFSDIDFSPTRTETLQYWRGSAGLTLAF